MAKSGGEIARRARRQSAAASASENGGSEKQNIKVSSDMVA